MSEHPYIHNECLKIKKFKTPKKKFEDKNLLMFLLPSFNCKLKLKQKHKKQLVNSGVEFFFQVHSFDMYIFKFFNELS